MKIELDDLLKSLDPGPIVLVIGGESFAVKDMSIDQVKRLNTFSTMSESEGLEFLRSLFADRVPPVVDALRESNEAGDAEPFGKRQGIVKQVAFIIATIVAACDDVMNGSALRRAVDQLSERVRPPAEASDA